MSQSFNNNTNSLNTTVNFTVADDQSDILAWLSPLNPKLRHQDIRERRVGNVGEWLLQTEEFKGWDSSSGGESDKAVLFCYGDPGVGKTFISSLVIDRLCDEARGRKVAVACFYFDFAAQKEQSSASILGAVLKQVVRGLEEVPEEIVQAYEDHGKVIDGRGPQLADIVKMLQTAVSKKRTFICIDALDECVAGYRVKLLDSLHQILQRSPGTRIFMTGRPHIRAEIEKRVPGRVTAIRITPQRHDIVSYLHTRLGEDTIPDAMDCSLKAEILEKIPGDISEIFLLVSLNIDAILQETTIHRRRQKLKAMTEGLGLAGAYGETLSRIKGQGGEKARLGMAALMWISHSERPMRVDELCHALGVEIGSQDLNGDNVPSIGTLLGCCQGLVAVDREAFTARLIHFTLRDYLRAHPELFGRAHSTMAETCLSYLNSNQVRAIPASPSRHLRGTPSLEYSSRHSSSPVLQYSSLYSGPPSLGYSSQRSSVPLPESFSRYPITPLLGDPPQYSCDCMDCSPQYYPPYSSVPVPRYSSLRSGSSFGGGSSSVHPSAPLLGNSASRSRTPFLGYSSLRSGSSFGGGSSSAHSSAPLLGNSSSRSSTPFPGYSSLRSGSSFGGGSSVHSSAPLLGNSASRSSTPFPGYSSLRSDTPSRVDPSVHSSEPLVEYSPSYSSTPFLEYSSLYWGIHAKRDFSDCAKRLALKLFDDYNSHISTKILLNGEKSLFVYANFDRSSLFSGLHCAAFFGIVEIVAALVLVEGCDINQADCTGSTPLMWAALNGQEGAVEILLGCDDVSPDKPDHEGRTPLWGAAKNGHDGVVRILLGRDDVSPDKPNEYRETPLWWAAKNGHEGMVRILLGRGDVNPDKPDILGQTPLCWAAKNGHEGVAKILLERDDVNPNKPDTSNQTPLWYAAKSGHRGVVEILLGRDDVNLDEQNKYGETPLWWAAMNGHVEVMKILLSRGGVNPDKADSDGRTPLWCATESEHEEAVEILVGRGDVNPDQPDILGQTPLWCAAKNGNERVMKILLGRDGINPDKADSGGRTPLCCAAMNGHGEVMETLLGRHDVNPNQPDTHGQTPLCYAAMNGHGEVMEILLGRDDVNPNQPDTLGLTPLCWAAKNGHEGVAKILLGRDNVNPNKPDNQGRTPLRYAISNWHQGVVKIFLGRGIIVP